MMASAPPPLWPQARQPAPPARLFRRGGVLLLLGALLCACWLAVRLVPVDHSYTLPQLETLCQSGLGQVAQVFSSRAAHDCQDVRKVVPIADPVLIGGLALLSAGAWRVLNSLRGARR